MEMAEYLQALDLSNIK